MNPDTPRTGAERLTRLERTVSDHAAVIARMQGDISSNTEMIRALAPIVAQLATVAEAQRNLKDAMIELRHDWRSDVKHFDEEIETLSRTTKDQFNALTTNQQEDRRSWVNFQRLLWLTIISVFLTSGLGLLIAVLSTH